MKTFRIVSVVIIIAMIAGLVGFGSVSIKAQQVAQVDAKPERIAIGAMQMSGVHLVPPARNALDAILLKDGLSLNASPEQRAAAEDKWFDNFQKQSDTWISPGFLDYVNEREKQLGGLPNNLNLPANLDVATAIPVTATVFAMAVDFGATEVFTITVDDGTGTCVPASSTIDGPLVGEVPAPEADDNFSLWYLPSQVSDAKFYEKIIFGYEGAGRTRLDLTDPDDGLPGIDLTGYTVQDYYDNVAGEGNIVITGTVEGWVTVDHSEGYYGADNCEAGSHGGGAGVPVAQLVIDAVDVFSDTHPTYWTDSSFWPKYDANHDGFLDTFWIIHAGVGQEAGGGEEGTFAIWSHSSDLRYSFPEGYQVYEGDTGTDADDIYVGPYTMQPEMSETGVFAEEFGHNFFGLPDLYTTDSSNSIGFWNIMAGGAWMGWLGGTAPASMPLWFKMIAAAEVDGQYVPLNWQQPMVTRDYKDPSADIEIGQLEKTPAGVNRGVRVNLPPINEEVPNYAGSGAGAYSGTGRNQLDITLTTDLAIPAGADGVLSLDAYWEIEEDWDYGYVMVNGEIISDTTGYFTTYDPNGNNLGWGLTGFGEDTLTFDLSAYEGQTVELTLRYRTDAAVTEIGWWVDNVMLDGVLVDDFSGASDSGTFPGWVNSDPGWYTVPTSRTYASYYLVEWRSNTKYDGMIAKTAYVFNDDDTVSRIPYNMPAALVYYRSTKYSSTYAQRPNYGDQPSFGSKYQLLIVDQNWNALRMMSGGTTYRGYLTGRGSSYDSGLTLQPSQAFTIPNLNGWDTTWGPFNVASKPAVTHFNDALGYYGGLFYGTPCAGICWVERDGSAVLPARDAYSTRISDFYYNPYIYWFGLPVGALGLLGDSWFGTGRPAEDNVQHGLNIQLLSKTGDDAYDSKATLRFYNYSVDFLYDIVSSTITPDGVRSTYQFNIQNVGTEDASDLSFEWYLATGQQIVSMDVAGPQDLVYNVAAEALAVPQRVDEPQDYLGLEFPALASGQEIVVTINTFTPGPIIGGDAVNIYTEFWANDGQISRGPYWVDLITTANFVFIPIITK